VRSVWYDGTEGVGENAMGIYDGRPEKRKDHSILFFYGLDKACVNLHVLLNKENHWKVLLISGAFDLL